jgi:hypothetical protein
VTRAVVSRCGTGQVGWKHQGAVAELETKRKATAKKFYLVGPCCLPAPRDCRTCWRAAARSASPRCASTQPLLQRSRGPNSHRVFGGLRIAPLAARPPQAKKKATLLRAKAAAQVKA